VQLANNRIWLSLFDTDASMAILKPRAKLLINASFTGGAIQTYKGGCRNFAACLRQ
jgi:hypothetical protein